MVGFLGQNTVFLEQLAFNGTVIAPFTTLVLRAVSGIHTGFFAAKDLQVIDAHARVQYRTPLPLITASNPTWQSCRQLIPLRSDLSGQAQQAAYQQDIARYCPGWRRPTTPITTASKIAWMSVRTTHSRCVAVFATAVHPISIPTATGS